MLSLLKQEFKTVSGYKATKIIIPLLALYVIIIGIASDATHILMPLQFVQTLGGAGNVISMIMFIAASIWFGANENRSLITKSLEHHSKSQVFIARIFGLALLYIYLLLTALVSTFIVHKLLMRSVHVDSASVEKIMATVVGSILFCLYTSLIIILISNLFKNKWSSISGSIAIMYLFYLVCAILMFLLYFYRFLRFSPFNFLMIQEVFTNPVTHMMTRTYLPGMIKGTITYSIIIFLIDWFVFKVRKFNR
ncbi:hypothetical protein WR164_04230 [Philodulcilactobacillus myokoensis]|uniref:Uncharacterized protein n=1 Tax=Philodulcilactobacillus myokoensis TaxID=2929573 RepID=A0A9W6AZW5_9LACO|nr:hypothetical protein [Philodulcilactobacillus myokoensis]GLB46444.1 hypothetical protein WR164_04230 [Philodulcilactobacillus myokoensis]